MDGPGKNMTAKTFIVRQFGDFHGIFQNIAFRDTVRGEKFDRIARGKPAMRNRIDDNGVAGFDFKNGLKFGERTLRCTVSGLDGK